MHKVHADYRPDIDGLRAIAILCVVIFHAFPSELSGGFVGVDVFFVISGYLISTILFRDLQRGQFSFAGFYARRIRRIFPAFILVLVAVYAAGWFVLLADEFKQLGLHIAASAGFVQNFVLLQEKGYFDVSSELKPLAHIWSLSVEEQFYLVFPAVVWGVWRTGLNVLAPIAVLAFVSFVANVNSADTNASLAFYMPHTRFWELFAGAALAHWQLFRAVPLSHVPKLAAFYSWLVHSLPKPERRHAVLADALAVIGMVLIFASALILDSSDPYPSYGALMPVIGSAMVIFAGPVAWVNRRILSNRFMVMIGLISYPLYLWHWPLLSLVNIVENGASAAAVRLGAVVLACALAWLTYYLLERPLRFGNKGRTKVLLMLLSMAAFGGVGYATYLRDGLGFRQFAAPVVYEGDVGHAEFYKYISQKFYPCTPQRIFDEALKWEHFTRCYQSQNRADVDLALIGDSHAEHLFIGLAEQLPHKNVAYYIKDGAAFIDNPDYSHIFRNTIESKSIKQVILTMSWAKRSFLLTGSQSLDHQLARTADALLAASKQVFITDDTPSFSYDPRSCRVNRALSRGSNCVVGSAEALWVLHQYGDALQGVAKEDPRIHYLHTYKYLCSTEECSMLNGTQLLYRDKNHLNINGSKFVAQKMVEDNPVLKQD